MPKMDPFAGHWLLIYGLWNKESCTVIIDYRKEEHLIT